MSVSTRVGIALGERSYEVIIGPGLLASAGTLIREAGLPQRHAWVLTNGPVGDLYFDPLRTALEQAGFAQVVRHDIPAGEDGKNWDELSRACAALVSGFPETGTVPLVVLLGGGVVGDLGGFAAGLFRRGVPFVQIPTTLLAAVDSSVGGKVAVNFGGVKNILGIFNQPSLVLCDLLTLRSLPPRELSGGMAEVIKYAAVCSRELFERLEGGDLERILALDPAVLSEVVATCVRLKGAVVEQDERDQLGVRNVLNFGHTFGHGLELSADYALTHGEAVAIGMCAATHLAEALGMNAPDFRTRLRNLIERAGLPTTFPDSPGLFDRIVRAMQLDKKFREGRNVFVLPTGIGTWQQCENVNWPTVHAALRSVLR